MSGDPKVDLIYSMKIKIYPIAARLIDLAVLEKLRGAASVSVPQVEGKP
jgi:hypothetical protein